MHHLLNRGGGGGGGGFGVQPAASAAACHHACPASCTMHVQTRTARPRLCRVATTEFRPAAPLCTPRSPLTGQQQHRNIVCARSAGAPFAARLQRCWCSWELQLVPSFQVFLMGDALVRYTCQCSLHTHAGVPLAAHGPQHPRRSQRPDFLRPPDRILEEAGGSDDTAETCREELAMLMVGTVWACPQKVA